MPGCSVAFCKNMSNSRNRGKVRFVKVTQVTFHKFPSDKNFRAIWLKICKKANETSVDPRVCSDHFKPEDYIRDLQNELLGLPLRKKLKPDAVPTLKLNGEIESKNKVRQQLVAERRKARIEKRDIRKRALERLRKLTVGRDKSTDCSDLPNPEVERLKETNKKLHQQIEKLKALHVKFRDETNIRLGSLRNKIGVMQMKQREDRKQSAIKIEKRIYEILGQSFSRGQIRCYLKKKNSVKWSKYDIEHALKIREFSASFYRYMRNKLKIPLPGLSTLRRWDKLQLSQNSNMDQIPEATEEMQLFLNFEDYNSECLMEVSTSLEVNEESAEPVQPVDLESNTGKTFLSPTSDKETVAAVQTIQIIEQVIASQQHTQTNPVQVNPKVCFNKTNTPIRIAPKLPQKVIINPAQCGQTPVGASNQKFLRKNLAQTNPPTGTINSMLRQALLEPHSNENTKETSLEQISTNLTKYTKGTTGTPCITKGTPSPDPMQKGPKLLIISPKEGHTSTKKVSLELAPKGGKECSNCTLVNNKNQNVCEACGTRLDNSPTYI